MHILGATQFLTTLAISIATTVLVSRVLFLMVQKWRVGIGKVALVNGASFVVSYALLVIWCSTSEAIYWFVGHVVFAPQVCLFVYDVLHWTGEESSDEAFEEIDAD